MVSVLVALLSAAVSLGVLVVAIRRTRREPRRLSNGFWLLAGTLLALQVAAGVGVPGAGLVQGLLVLLVIGAPVLIDVVAVFLIINGVIMLRRESRSPANALSLLAGLALLALSLSPFVLLLGAPLWLIAALLFVGLAAAYLGFVFVGFLLYSWLYPRLVRGRPARWVVVLGSGLIDGDRVPPLLAGRIAAGQTAYAERGAQLMIMSGGQGHDETVPEARAMAAWAAAQGADTDRLAVEDRSRTTEENLRFTAELIARTPPAEPEVPVTTGSPGARIPHGLDRLLGGPITPRSGRGADRHQRLPRAPGRDPRPSPRRARAGLRRPDRALLLAERHAAGVRRAAGRSPSAASGAGRPARPAVAVGAAPRSAPLGDQLR